MAYRLHNEDALLAAAQLIANALNITTSTDSSPPNAQNRLWQLKCSAMNRGAVVTIDQLTGHMEFHCTRGAGKISTIRLNFWSPEVPTTIICSGESITFNWDGTKMITQQAGAPPEWLRTPADPEISPGINRLRRTAGCTHQQAPTLRFQQT